MRRARGLLRVSTAEASLAPGSTRLAWLARGRVSPHYTLANQIENSQKNQQKCVDHRTSTGLYRSFAALLDNLEFTFVLVVFCLWLLIKKFCLVIGWSTLV